MSSFEATFPFHSAFFLVVKLVILLHLLKEAKTQVQSQTPQISASVAKYICDQQNLFQETGKIQSPLKSRPENDDSKCGWYFWGKCDLNSESCPSFDLKTCQETEMGRKKGKGVAKQGSRDPCFNSTGQGLPNPEIVGSMSKYPSVVTIEVGEICQVKECAGLILDKNWIIVQQTGCFKYYKPNHSDYHVIVAGERRMHVEEGTEQRRNVAEYIPHPGLELVQPLKYYKNDIGLVRVSTPFEFNNNVQPIDLAAIGAFAPSIENSSLKIVGWIMAQPMKEDEELLASLMESPLDFVPTDKCFDKQMEQMEGGEMEAPNTTLICCGKCLVHGDEKNQPRRSILYAQEGSGSNSPSVPVGLGPLKFKGGKPQFGVFLKLAPYIPWIKETAKSGRGQSEGETTTEGAEYEYEPRIKRGEDAPPYKYKSLGNLETSSSYACRRHGCGGLILNEEWLLTAAHCLVRDPLPEHYRVIVGDHDITNNDENEQILAVSKIIIHENWDTTKNLNDIAVIKVTPPFKFNDRVQKVTLPDPSFEGSEPLTAVGWGENSDFIRPHILQQVQLPFVPQDECQKLYPTQPLTEGDICAGNSTHGIGNGKFNHVDVDVVYDTRLTLTANRKKPVPLVVNFANSCYPNLNQWIFEGDSGGPLYDISESGEQIVVGLVSIVGASGLRSENSELNEMSYQINSQNGGLGAEQEVQPGVFTKVSHHLDWIKKNAEMSA